MAEPELWTRCPKAEWLANNPDRWWCDCHGEAQIADLPFMVRVSFDEMVERAARWWNEGLEPYPPRVAFIADLLRAALAPEEGT